MKQIMKCMAIAGIILCLPKTAFAQMNINIVNKNEVLKAEAIDEVLFSVQYETTFLPDTLNTEKVLNETMMLKVGKKSSVYYSYAKFLTDSIIEIDKKNGASIDVISAHMEQYNSKVSYKIYKNHPVGKVTYLDQLGMNRFLCEEKMEMPKWTLLSDTMTIASYVCQKATCSLYGRNYEVWYTTEIARGDGPWKLQGLPGLILKAQDTQGHYTFVCTGITQNHDKENKIMYSTDGYQPISRKELNKMYTRYAADPVGFVTSSAPNVQIVVRGADGNPIKKPVNTPFNPIERE
ncbi:GLPGLI family protein [Bacteroides sp. 214]|uniref:GLPGLI family protein n=1 Tax=Bacteroides sp. 214 TaxID=2302935 RepID=UPI001EF1B64E|nr:GLPGLI family protein [Bacteroides sp. 214]